MKRRLAALAFAALVAPAAGRADAVGDAVRAGVAQQVAADVAARSGERGLSPDDALAPIAAAAKRGLPSDLVAAKILEGLAKGAPPARVLAVARGLEERLAAADALLASSNLPPPADERAALADLADAMSHGVTKDAVEALVAAAHEARGGNSDSVVAAAHALGELARRGVPPADALGLGRALTHRAPEASRKVPGLFDAWRAEGGKDTEAFLDEARRRAESGQKLDGVVDWFGDSPDRLTHDRKPDKDGLVGSDVGRHGAQEGLGPGERSDAARGAVPGLDDAVRGNASAHGHGHPGRP